MAETDDGQRADHAEGQDHVAGDGQDDEGRDHRQSHEGDAELTVEHHALIGLLVDEIDEHADDEGEGDGDQGVDHGELRELLHETVFEDVVE